MTSPACILDVEGFASLFGISPDDFTAGERRIIAERDFRYRRFESTERDATLLLVLKRIESGDFRPSGRVRHTDWEKGWEENLARFVRSGFDLNELVPRYVRPNQPVRLNREYVMPLDPSFELNFYTVLRQWLFRTYLSEGSAIYEFGCGTGYNLALLAGIYPGKKLYGLDWAGSAVELVNRIGQAHGFNLTGLRFDMFSPDTSLQIEPGSMFLTMNSLEQLGDEHEKLIRFFLDKRPSACVHAEPFYEYYDEENLVDYVAMKYHGKRKYLTGYVTRLRQLEREGKIEILCSRRIPFGSLFHEGYSLLVWKPAPRAG